MCQTSLAAHLVIIRTQSIEYVSKKIFLLRLPFVVLPPFRVKGWKGRRGWNEGRKQGRKEGMKEGMRGGGKERKKEGNPEGSIT